MKIHGFQKTTLLDYPGHVAATVFMGGCNFRCPFCHNASLVLNPEKQPLIPAEEVLNHLEKRKGILEGVCITGGEPTLEHELKQFMLRCREMGYLVKLDTNGYRPEVLRELVKERIVDYVAMDIKASLKNYSAATGCPNVDTEKIQESIYLLLTSHIAYEFRTTVVKGIHFEEEFEEIGKLLSGCSLYCLQAFRESGDILGQNTAQRPLEPFTKQEMERMAALAGKYTDKVVIRGVE